MKKILLYLFLFFILSSVVLSLNCLKVFEGNYYNNQKLANEINNWLRENEYIDIIDVEISIFDNCLEIVERVWVYYRKIYDFWNKININC